MGRKLKSKPKPFEYPLKPHIRKHGPFGYKHYKYYRDWLRDEFNFRCVFCLKREQWDIISGNWDIDHFIPQSIDPIGVLSYENLLYTCHSCNVIKSDHIVPNPCKVALGKCVMVRNDGEIIALNDDGEILIEVLRLGNKDRVRWRHLIINTIHSLAKTGNEKALTLWMRYPEDLPDLSKQTPPGNIKPKSVQNSHYARRLRSVLPETY